MACLTRTRTTRAMMKIGINHATAPGRIRTLPPAPAKPEAQRFGFDPCCLRPTASRPLNGLKKSREATLECSQTRQCLVVVGCATRPSGTADLPSHSPCQTPQPQRKPPLSHSSFARPQSSATVQASPSQSKPVQASQTQSNSVKPSQTKSSHCSSTAPVLDRRDNQSDESIQMARNRQSRRSGEHTRPGCRFPRPRGKPFAPGCIKRSSKTRAHDGESQRAFRYAPHIRFRIPYPCCEADVRLCGSKPVQPSPSQSNQVKPCVSARI